MRFCKSFPRVKKLLLQTAVLAIVLLSGVALAQSIMGQVEGTVRTRAGTGIAGATIRAKSSDGKIDTQALSSDRGRFVIDLPSGQYQLFVSAAGFSPRVEPVDLQAGAQVDVTVELAAATETVIVTASRMEQPLDQQIQDVTMLSRERLDTTPALVLDDALRQIPGFSLFRRSSSLAAHPTAQGVSLRGVGPSGVSRTLLLWDGIPLNDPFGGWIVWNQVPVEAIDRIEVMRGGGSELYGSSALGGVLQILNHPAGTSHWSGTLLAGKQGVVSGDGFVSGTAKGWDLAAALKGFRNDGYHQIEPARRGRIDRRLRAAFESGWLRIGRRLDRWDFGFSGTFLHEERINGTSLQRNQTNLGRVALNTIYSASSSTQWRGTLHWQQSEFQSSFSRIIADRNQEFLTSWQTIPARGAGASLMWIHHRERHAVSAGGDWLRVTGESDENLFDTTGTRVTGARSAGGVQHLFGFFLQDLISVSSRMDVQLAARVDGWDDRQGFRTEFAGASVNRVHFADRRRWNFSPRIGAQFKLTSDVRLRGSAYRSFRAPNLNELYRPFRVGNVETRANEALVQESLTGGEFGGDWKPRSNVTLRLTGFFQSLINPVSNITLLVEPNRIVRQRQNLGRVRVSGLETEWSWAPAAVLHFHASYLWNRTRVTRFDPVPAVVGKRLPQVPLHQASAAIAWRPDPRWNVSLQGRLASNQFDDDLNQFGLGYYNIIDGRIGFRATPNVELFAQVENLLDRNFLVGRTPTPLQGSPIQAQIGLRLRR